MFTLSHAVVTLMLGIALTLYRLRFKYPLPFRLRQLLKVNAKSITNIHTDLRSAIVINVNAEVFRVLSGLRTNGEGRAIALRLYKEDPFLANWPELRDWHWLVEQEDSSLRWASTARFYYITCLSIHVFWLAVALLFAAAAAFALANVPETDRASAIAYALIGLMQVFGILLIANGFPNPFRFRRLDKLLRRMRADASQKGLTSSTSTPARKTRARASSFATDSTTE